MDIFEFAMQMELDGAKLYRELAEKSQDAGIKRILGQLADDEHKHHAILKSMSESVSPDMSETSVLTDAINIFTSITKDDLDLSGEQIDVYRRAAEIEAKSEAFYVEKAGEVDNEAQRELLLQIADEEKRHRHLLEGMVEFLQAPDTWLENGEFVNLGNY